MKKKRRQKKHLRRWIGDFAFCEGIEILYLAGGGFDVARGDSYFVSGNIKRQLIIIIADVKYKELYG